MQLRRVGTTALLIWVSTDTHFTVIYTSKLVPFSLPNYFPSRCFSYVKLDMLPVLCITSKSIQKYNHMNFQMGKHFKTIRHCWCLHTLQTHLGHIIIPKPHCSSRESVNSPCRRFDLFSFRCVGPTCRCYDHINRSCSCRSGWSLVIDRPCSALRPFSFNRHLSEDRSSRLFLSFFSRINNARPD